MHFIASGACELTFIVWNKRGVFVPVSPSSIFTMVVLGNLTYVEPVPHISETSASGMGAKSRVEIAGISVCERTGTESPRRTHSTRTDTRPVGHLAFLFHLVSAAFKVVLLLSDF